jgi:hypothetical protein
MPRSDAPEPGQRLCDDPVGGRGLGDVSLHREYGSVICRLDRERIGRDRPALVAVPGDNAGADAMATFCSFSLIGLSFLPLAGRVVRSFRYLRGEALPEGHGSTPAPSPGAGNLDTDLEARSSQPGDHAVN